MTNTIEIWKDIKNYEGYYQISNFGNFKSVYRKVTQSNNTIVTVQEKLIKPSIDAKGYPRIGLYKPREKRKNERIHRLVALHFIPNPLNLPQVNHINGIKTDNSVENLEWCTNKENTEHAVINNLKKGAVGELHGKTKLKNIDIINIRQLRENGKSLKEIGLLYNLSEKTICDISLRRSWKHIN